MESLSFFSAKKADAMMRRYRKMILATILILIALILTAVTIIAIAFGGAVMTVIFSDVIVCIFIIVALIRHLIRKK